MLECWDAGMLESWNAETLAWGLFRISGGADCLIELPEPLAQRCIFISDVFVVCIGEVRKPMGKMQEVLGLSQRSQTDVRKMSQFPITFPGVPFHEISWYG